MPESGHKPYYESWPKFMAFVLTAVGIGIVIAGAFNIARDRPVFDHLSHSIVRSIVLAGILTLVSRCRASRAQRRNNR